MTISFINYSMLNKRKIPNDALFLLKKLEEAGFLSFLVGGCVRDLICQKTGKDWDIVTDASPEQIQKIFYNFKALLIGRSFQTVTLIINSQVYHISTIRNGEKQNSVFYNKDRNHLLIRDLLCRDFTINALAWNPDKGILDPSNGLRDLKRKVIRSLKPDVRFQEDPLRILRAVRIACELNFAIDMKTKSSIIEKAFLIHRVSPERIREEVCSMLKTFDAQRGILLLKQYGLERYIFSIDKLKRAILFSKETKQLSFLGFNELREDLPAQLALWGRLYFGSCHQAHMFYLPLIYNLKFNKRIIKRLKVLLSREWILMDLSSGKNIRFLMSELGKENIKVMFCLKKILLLTEQNTDKINMLLKEEKIFKEELKRNPPVTLKDLAIKGENLIKIGIPAGKRIGETLQLLLYKILISPEINNKDCLISIVKEMRQKSN